MTTACWAEGGDLWVADAATGSILWHGQPDGFPVESAVAIPGTNDCVVLFAPSFGPEFFWHHKRRWENVARVRPDGTIAWHAPLPDPMGYDVYVRIEWTGEGLVAWSWSCFRVHLDAETGQILSATFTK